MAIHTHNKNIDSLYHGSKSIASVYRGLVLVWQKTPVPTVEGACFSEGYWNDDLAWLDDRYWKNNTNG